MHTYIYTHTQTLHIYVYLRDPGARKGVGLDHVGSREEVSLVDVADRVRLGEDEQVVVALELLLNILPALT